MEIHLAPETEAQLRDLAVREGKNAAQVVEETVTSMLKRHAEFIEGVERGMAAANRGEFVESSEVWANANSLPHRPPHPAG